MTAVDDFVRLVAQAKDQLSAREGRPVSWREVVRRAGYDESEFGRVSYHLLPRKRARGHHHVKPELVDRLAPVFADVTTRAELMWAAATAAGYDLPRPGADGIIRGINGPGHGRSSPDGSGDILPGGERART